MAHEYIPPKVWINDSENGEQWSSINRSDSKTGVKDWDQKTGKNWGQVFHCANNFSYHYKRQLLCTMKDLMEWSAPLPKRLQVSQNRMSCSDIIQNKKRRKK